MVSCLLREQLRHINTAAGCDYLSILLLVVGPKLTTPDGESMSKSAGLGITFNAMYHRFGKDTAAEVLKVVQMCAHKRMSHLAVHPTGF